MARYAPRTELLNWLNDTLDLNYTDLKEAANGAAFCQIIDAIYPGKVPMQRVNFNAKLEYEFEKNYKILQDSFTKLKINKAVDVEKLSKGKFTDVLDFCQWIKQYYFTTVGDGRQPGYDPQSRRTHGAGAPLSHPSTAASQRKGPTSNPPSAAGGSRSPQRVVRSAETSAKPSPDANAQILALQKKLDEIIQDRDALRSESENIERERDFYFEKLRQIETLCQPHDKEPLIKEIMQILYAAEGEFQAEDDGQVDDN